MEGGQPCSFKSLPIVEAEKNFSSKRKALIFATELKRRRIIKAPFFFALFSADVAQRERGQVVAVAVLLLPFLFPARTSF